MVRTIKPTVQLADSLDYLGSVAEFLEVNDFENTLAALERARVIIRQWEEWIALLLAEDS